MLSSKQIGGHGQTSEPVASGSVVNWVLANDGTMAWPAGTTLRLVSGPILTSPILEVPPAAPGQTLELDLEVVTDQEGVQEAAYALVTPCGQPFGDLLQLRAGAKPSLPSCVVLKGPETCIEALQGEVKTLRWTLANVGSVSWPADTCCKLFYNTPGFDVPCFVEMPDVQPGLTVELEVPVLLPEKEGRFKAMWAVTSPSVPDFGEVLMGEFLVSDFPFMDWMLADEIETESFSVVSEEEAKAPSAPPLSATHLMHEHMVADIQVSYPDEMEGKAGFVSLGNVSGSGLWVVRIIIKNNGALSWPEDCALACCFGSGFGCPKLNLGEVQAGEVIDMCMELQAEPGCSGWVLSSGGFCFGPVFLAQVDK